MSMFLKAVIAISIALSAGTATADTTAQQTVNRYRAMWESCAAEADAQRDRCMLEPDAQGKAARGRCDERMSRAQKQCLLEFVGAKRPAVGAK